MYSKKYSKNPVQNVLLVDSSLVAIFYKAAYCSHAKRELVMKNSLRILTVTDYIQQERVLNAQLLIKFSE